MMLPDAGGGFDPVGAKNTKYNEAHEKSDVDIDDASIHHTLGLGRYQAAPGVIVGAIKQQLLDQIGIDVKFAVLDQIPAHYLPMLGQSLSTTEYDLLFAKVGYKWGGSGGTFMLPDTRRRFLMGGDLTDIGETDGYPYSTRQVLNQHQHNHGGIISLGATTNISVTGGSHSHSSGTLATGLSGNHSHGLGSATDTVTVQSGSGNNPATGGHSHIVLTDGMHSHLMSGSTGTSSASASVSDPGHTHGVNTDTVALTHSYIKLVLIIRYETGLEGLFA